jgi:pilus assembly protein CpaF
MVNAPDEVFFERDGILYLSDVSFRDDVHIYRVIERIVAPIGRRIDESSPMVDARLPDGSRVNVVIPPVAPKSPTITIRKFRADKMTMDDLVTSGSIEQEMVEFLKACVKMRLNILVSGGTGTGKTTFLNALSASIPDSERIVTIEDPVEVKLQQPHVVSLEARPANIDGKGEVSQRDLLRNTLRMRPDRIIIGEVRGPEAFDMLNAMNTGHEGSLSTVHANSPRDALARIENMVLMANLDLPDRAIREQTASALHLLIQLSRFTDGVRRVTHITECTGMEGEIITLQDLFMFEQTGVNEDGRVLGRIAPTGIRPGFAERFESAGVELPAGLFLPGIAAAR